MRLIDGAKADARLRAAEEWHQWFAWFPVIVDNGDVLWLEHVERSITYADAGDGLWRLCRYRSARR